MEHGLGNLRYRTRDERLIMNKQSRENEKARKGLRSLKEMYELTWPQVAKVFGKSLRTIENWAGGQNNIPPSDKELIRIYSENPDLFKDKL